MDKHKFDYPRTPTTAVMRVTMPDGSKWDVPAQTIADSRDDNYRDEEEDTIGFIRNGSLDDYELTDWAANNLNWSDVEAVARRVEEKAPAVDFQEGWVNGEKKIVGKI
jgi:hypothetical protein